ncbi:hypothetical protein LO762_28755 [Actinocorallia sp. API 0066]|uniref:hypothetical protein n=1 Tax=Actinocorallia sp. API 0066 TaxID=2896846 RepID=UPI001E46116D|nr:hypothetical protein [Actinocorallia sp. API 0066]MCD0453140.1 hypothetical protein [Actinocorallia sp. API 0066]
MIPLVRVAGTPGGRLVILLSVTAVGWAVGLAAGADTVANTVTSSGYFTAISALLAVGLYASAHGIDRTLLKQDLRTAVAAVTVGVVAKAALISGVMFLFWPGPLALVAGIAVAQIDPLSVRALQDSTRLSARGQNLLLVWSSFDDPVTTVLTLVLAAVAIDVYGLGATAELGGAGFASFAGTLGLTLLLAVGVLLLALALRRLGGRWRGGLALALLAGVGVVAVTQFWMLLAALVGLFLRPGELLRTERARARWDGALDRLVAGAFGCALLVMGFVLAVGVDPLAGVVLGLAAYFAQVVVGLILTRGRPPGDRAGLALAQQNGITAIVLALVLQPAFPEVVGVVAPALLTVNVLHALAGSDRIHTRLASLLTPRRGSPPEDGRDDPAWPVAGSGTSAGACGWGGGAEFRDGHLDEVG